MAPFLIGGSLWYFSQNAGGWDELRFFLILILSMPVLAGMAAFSVVFAFRKDDGVRKLRLTSRVASVVSLAVFGGLVLMGCAGIIQSLRF
ncbi:hypothetical protein [Arthrobacter sp. HLT1-20]